MKKFFALTLIAAAFASAIGATVNIKDNAAGYQLGTTAQQPLGFFGNTPAVQPSNVSARSALQTLGLLAPDATTTATAVAGAATLNAVIGKVTSEALTTAAGSDYVLTLTNSAIATTSIVTATVDNGTNTTEGLSVQRVTPGNGTCVIRVRNTNASVAWNGTIKIGYIVH